MASERGRNAMLRWTAVVWADAVLWSGVVTLVFGLTACAQSAPRDSEPVLAFAVRFEPAATEENVVPRLPEPSAEVTAALERRPLSTDARLGVALIGTRLYRYHVECFGQAYELRQSEPNPILQAFAALSRRDQESAEFLPSSAIHDWVLLQEDLAANPLIHRETKRIEAALKRDRWSSLGE